MKFLKFALRVSVFANIVLVLWALSQRTHIQERNKADAELDMAMEQSVKDLKEANAMLQRTSELNSKADSKHNSMIEELIDLARNNKPSKELPKSLN